MSTIRTDRLTLRPITHDDVETFLEYRNQPETLQWLGSRIPLTVESARASVAAMAAAGGPTPGAWYRWAIDLDGTMVGDIATEIRPGGGIAEVGYVLDPSHRGHGYASEALAGLVDHVISSYEIHRIEASLSPDNVASMRVLESVGMRFEVVARLAYCRDGQWEDDLRYAMTAEDRQAWVERPRHPPETVEVVEIDPGEAYLWGRLTTHYSQQEFVATMPLTWRDALFPEDFEGVLAEPVMRGILADGERAGFMMMSTNHGTSNGWYLWRMLIDRMHQRRGIGARALMMWIDELRQQGVPRIYTSDVEGPGGPRPFYEGLGFVTTGRIIDEETELVLELG